MDGLLAGRVVLVTGAARGQGAAIARLFVAQGAKVALADIADHVGMDLADELGDAAHYLHLNVANEHSWRYAVSETLDQFGKLDGLVNNAGIIRRAPILETSKAQWDEVIAICQTGIFLGMRTVARPIADAGGGTIVNTSSTSGFWGLANIAAYTAAKFAVRGLTRVAAIEFANLGIRVNTVCPGVIDTPMATHIDVADQDANIQGAWTASQVTLPMGRKGSPNELASVVLFLSSNLSSYCTGADFLCDGGRLAGPITS